MESLNIVPDSYSRIIGTSSTGALALLVYEYFLTLDDEVELIWSKPNRSFLKWLFLFMRYFGAASQIGNQLLSKHVASTVPITLYYCRLWYTWRLVACQTMLTAVEATLIMRVYALYNRNKRIAVTLALFVCCEVTVSAINCIINIPKMHFSPACLTVLSLRPVIQFGMISTVTQSSILFLTIAKQLVAARTGWGRTPLVSLMIRDGAFAFVMIFGSLVATLAFMTTPKGLAFVQSWLISIMFCIGCRLIVNMQRLVVPKEVDSDPKTQEPAGFELTSDIGDFPTFATTIPDSGSERT